MSNYDKIEQIASDLYSVYSESVGGKAWNGDPLPDWATFRADPAKAKQVEGWLAVARKAAEFGSLQHD